MSAIEFTQEDLERASATGKYPNPAPAPFDPRVVGRDIASRYGVSYEQMMGRDRCGNLPLARMAFWSFLRKNRWSYPQIGRFVSRDHTTIIAGVRKFDGTR
jgi:chromosomal replication initiation ATPase DnaA